MKHPVLPRPSSPSRDEVRRVALRLRRFHFGEPRSGDGHGIPAVGLRPALLPAIAADEIRSEFPVFVATRDAATGREAACSPIADLLGAALLASAGKPENARLVGDNLVRIERIARDLVVRAGGRARAAEVFAALGPALESELGLRGEANSQLREQLGALLAKLPEDGELLALQPRTPLSLFVAMARAAVLPRRRAFLAELAQLRDGLRALLEVDRQKDPAAHAPAALRDAVGSAGGHHFDIAALARVVGPHRGSVRLDARRREGLQAALATLDGHTAVSFGPLVTVLHGVPEDGFRHSAWAVVDESDVTCSEAVDPCAAAARQFDEESARLAAVFRAVRLARLELGGAYEPERHDAWLASLDRSSFTRDELLLVPTVLAVTTGERLSGPELASLSQLLESGRPVHVLAFVDPADAPSPDAPSPDAPSTGAASPGAGAFRLELGYLGIGHREAFVQQSTAARPVHLAAGFRRGLDTARSALHVVATGLLRDGSEPASGAWLHAGAAIEGRAHPLFRYDPEAGSTWARRFEFDGNPSPATDWPLGTLRCRETNGADQDLTLAFTFADFALLEPGHAHEFTVVEPDFCDDAVERVLVPVDELLAREAEAVPSGAQAALAIPFVHAIDAAGEIVRVVISRRLLAACRDRLGFWRTLQELAGVRSEYVREAVLRERESGEERARAEREQLLAAHRGELERVRDNAVAEAMAGLARSLLELGPMALGDGRTALPSTTDGTACAVARPAASCSAPPPPIAPKEEVVVAGAPTPAVAVADEVAFAEAYIDTPLCTSCNDCRNLNPLLFVYDANKQARIGDLGAGTYLQLVQAAEKCPSKCIHPGLPSNPNEPDLPALIARAAPFNR
ncbi:MAG: ferredoxin [Planctomycetes bacterium]|nr:ferredoxin [Planctomycetota bacterium]